MLRKQQQRHTHRLALLGQVVQLANEDVDEDLEVVGIEIVSRLLGGEEEVEELEDEELHADIFCIQARRSVEHED